MVGTSRPLGRAHELLRELRLGIRRIEVVQSGSRDNNGTAVWTKNAIEVLHTAATAARTFAVQPRLDFIAYHSSQLEASAQERECP